MARGVVDGALFVEQDQQLAPGFSKNLHCHRGLGGWVGDARDGGRDRGELLRGRQLGEAHCGQPEVAEGGGGGLVPVAGLVNLLLQQPHVLGDGPGLDPVVFVGLLEKHQVADADPGPGGKVGQLAPELQGLHPKLAERVDGQEARGEGAQAADDGPEARGHGVGPGHPDCDV